ncbi:MAG: hypothetical protein N2689_05760 [Verrucomicrobiae bacterium]|nr:hypothetical protein [Verrucomicrobiae bacterium]
MSAEPLPLNAAQARSMAVTLGFLERDLQRLRDALAHPPRPLRLTRFVDPVPAHAGEALRAAAGEVERQLRKMADQLGLQPHVEPVRRSLASRLILDRVHLDEARASGGLRGYGSVDERTAEYLESEIPKLQALIDGLIEQIEGRADLSECKHT